MSHPAWVCGLKQRNRNLSQRIRQVTPCVGVWIETRLLAMTIVLRLSHPAWVCGLKQKRDNPFYQRPASHPAWVCGLKHYEEPYNS